ncbi:hypothetical protein [Ramlibacter pallidus]|uniref:Uncharacterized protein n=1 Tax=Ramlibacter pallidus TaxID=2780087 RepID=A0ABR9S4K4_9BURK|nr:hypothetical protein [Ramlibacter pallidus]MBE7368442.1 hypothetical protein [Ramlibacter pallidus]
MPGPCCSARPAAGKATEEGCWLFEEEPDDPFGLDDEFEGEGWSFWGD